MKCPRRPPKVTGGGFRHTRTEKVLVSGESLCRFLRPPGPVAEARDPAKSASIKEQKPTGDV